VVAVRWAPVVVPTGIVVVTGAEVIAGEVVVVVAGDPVDPQPAMRSPRAPSRARFGMENDGKPWQG
jgi:hypothetical protein